MKLVIQCFPHDDEDFAACVTKHVTDDELNARAIGKLGRSLRDVYPNAEIVLQDELAVAPGSGTRILYAYRDGTVYADPSLTAHRLQSA